MAQIPNATMTGHPSTFAGSNNLAVNHLLRPSFPRHFNLVAKCLFFPNQMETRGDGDGQMQTMQHHSPGHCVAPHPIIQFLFLSPNTIVKRQFQSQVSVILTRQTAVLSCTPLRGWRFSNWFVSWKGVPLRFSPFKLQQTT